MTYLQELEKNALTGNRDAIIEVVSALRKYREASTLLLEQRYRDGACDGVTLSRFASTIEEIEIASDGDM